MSNESQKADSKESAFLLEEQNEMKEWFDSLMAAFSERYQNKFIGTYIISFMIVNWKKVSILFFLDEMSYKDFVFAWSDGWFDFLLAAGFAFIIASGYLFLSPWLSFVVHKIQSDAKTRYKIQTIENQIKVFDEKQKMEFARKKVLELELKNVQSETDIKITGSQQSEIDIDRNRYRKILFSMPEKTIRKFSLELNNKNFDNNFIGLLREFYVEVDSVENEFFNKEMADASKFLAAKAKEILIEIEENKKIIMNRSVPEERRDKYFVRMTKLTEDLVVLYQNFYRLGAQNFGVQHT